MPEHLLELDNLLMQHVGDLEEWNEDAGFVWSPPSITYTQSLIIVIHPHTYPNVGRGIQGEPVHSTCIAVYTRAAEKVALWILDRGGTGSHPDHNYWGQA